MASEIRVNTFKNRSGLGTITVNDTGANFSGVVTATSFSGDGSSLTSLAPTQIVTGNTSVQTVDTGSDGHVKVTTEGTERVRINSSGNIGIGTIPQSWSGFRSLQLGGTTSIWSVEGGQAGSSFYSNNIYYDGSNRRYLTNNSASEYIQDASTGNHIFYEASSGTSGNTLSGYTEIARFTSDGLKVPSGSGIDFSATANGSGTTTSELLDDYEEGTWTPTLGNFTGTYTTQTGLYTKIGNIVTLHVHINVATNTGTSSLQYWIQGMPFSIVSTPSSTVGPVYIYEAATSTGHMISSMNSQPRWYVHPNNGLTSATSTNGHQAGQLGTGQIFATITYRVA